MMNTWFSPRFLSLIGALLILVSTTGCVYTNEISRTKRDIETHTDADFETGVVLSLGPGLFHTAGWLANMVDDEDAQMASRIVYGIRRVKAGVYPTSYLPDFEELDIPELARFKRRGWQVALKVVDQGEVSWLLYREKRRRVRDLFVISLTENELVLARIQGNLDELLNVALEEVEKEHFDAFDWEW